MTNRKRPIAEPIGLRPDEVTDVRIMPVTGAAENGILAYASVRYGGLRLDGFTVRRNREGLVIVGFPARWDRNGRRHFVVFAEDEGTRRQIERAILVVYWGTQT